MPLLEPVVDDAGDLGPVVVDLRLGLDERRDDDRLVRAHADLRLRVGVAELADATWSKVSTIRVQHRLLVLGVLDPVGLGEEHALHRRRAGGLEHGPDACRS